MAKTDDWMPLIIARWRRGTAFMTPAARGVYLDLLLVCWEQGSLPTADEVLQQLSRCTEKVWRQVRDAVRAKFDERDGFLHHDLVDSEKQKANEIYERKARAGKAGGEASGKHRAKQGRSRNEADVKAQDQAPANTTYQEHSPNGEKSADADLRPRRKRAISPDWKLTLKDRQYAASKGLDAQTIAAVAEQFLDYHTAHRTLSADWGASWRTWVANHIRWNGNAVQGRGAGQSWGHRSQPSSVLAAGAAVLSRLENQPGFRPDGSPDLEGDPTDGGGSGDGASGGADGPIIDGTSEPERNNLAAHPSAHRNENAA